jgi:hypothetical protein
VDAISDRRAELIARQRRRKDIGFLQSRSGHHLDQMRNPPRLLVSAPVGLSLEVGWSDLAMAPTTPLRVRSLYGTPM